ncbi:hypothetical protein RI129_008448 [Pyrocoelia pectoralis]|uniref:Nicotinamide riboside kinase 1 n=1 Tax=Pyrocoelia pectoralis TaxID=417401 RepID=A0AAN7VB43_9COLE
MSKNLLIIGISGVTCGGKTTLAVKLKKAIPCTLLISQDTYFLPDDDPRHTRIPELNHVNYDIISSLDMETMHRDIGKILEQYNTHFHNAQLIDKSSSLTNDELLEYINTKLKDTQTKILILEGFCIFNYKPVSNLCLLKYYMTLDREECLKRRNSRVYEPPDCPGYFEQCVWPEYLNLSSYVHKNVVDVTYFEGDKSPPVRDILIDIFNVLCNNN